MAPAGRLAMLAAGAAVTMLATAGPADAVADRLFSAHVAQHLILAFVAAPLLVAGGPLVLVLRALPRRSRQCVVRLLQAPASRVLVHPLAVWGLFVGAQWGMHYSSLFEASLEHAPVHAVEHALLLLAGVAFWWPVFGRPDVRPLSEPTRLAYIIAAIPATAFLGVSLNQAHHVLYLHYGGALADQQAGGEIMWIGGGAALFAAFMIVAGRWARREMLLAQREARS